MTKKELLEKIKNFPDNAELDFYTTKYEVSYYGEDSFDEEYSPVSVKIHETIDDVRINPLYWLHVGNIIVIPLKDHTFNEKVIDQEYYDNYMQKDPLYWEFYSHRIPKYVFETREEAEEFKRTYIFKH